VTQRTKRILLRLGAALAATLAALFAAEIALRLRLYGPRGLAPRWMNSVHALGDSGLLRPALVPDLRYQLAPDRDELFKMARLRTNSQGLRDREYPFGKPPATLRIAVVGDSFTMGSGVALEDVYHSVLERLLSSDPGGRACECINFGVGGYSIPDYTAVVRHLVPRYDPDLILVALTATDRSPPDRRAGPFVPRPATRPFFESLLVKEARHAVLRARRGAALRAARAMWESPADEGGDPLDEPTTRFLRGSLGNLARAARELGLPIAVVHLRAGAPPGGVDSRLTRAFRRACQEADLPYCDVSRRFAGVDSASFCIFHDDPHPNAAAHAIFAEEIQAFLLERGLIE